MEGMLLLIGVLLFIGLPIGAVMGMVAFSRTRELMQQIAELHRELNALRRRGQAPSATSHSDNAQASPVGEVAADVPAAVVSATVAPATAPLAPSQTARLDTALPVDVPKDQVVARNAVAPPSPEAAPLALASTPLVTMPAALVEPPPVEPPPLVAGEPSAAAAPASESPPSVVSSPDPVPPDPASSPAEPPRSVAANAATSAALDFEALVGKRWLTWSGVALLFLGGVFLLKYAYDQDWLGRFVTPPMRIGGIALGAVGMLVLGLRLLRQGMTALGQGLSGGAIALAYLAVYGGFSPRIMLVPEPLFPGQFAFVLMALITATGLTLAVRAQALPMALCALLGGFATPVLIDTGGGSRDALFVYVLLLDLGVLGVAWFRRWRALDVLAFVGTVVLYAGWHHSRVVAGAEPWGMLVWLLVFHLIFLLLPFAHHWRMRSPVTIERFALAVGNLAFTLGYAGVLLRHDHATVLAVLCLALAALYGGIGVLTRARVGEDRKVVHGFLALGTMLLTLGLFYLLPVDAIATAWAAEAVVLLVLGYRFAHAPTRVIAHGVLLLAVIRLLALRVPPGDLAADLIANAWFLALLMAPLGLAACAAVHRWLGTTELDRRWQIACWWLAGATMLLVGSGEIARHAAGHPAAWAHLPQATVHGVWWMAGAMGFLAGAWRWCSPATVRLAVLPLVIAVVLVFAAYVQAWPGGYPVINPRCLLALAVLGGPIAWWRCARCGAGRLGDTTELQPVLLVLTQLALLLLATTETMAWYGRALPGTQATDSGDLHLSLTVVWLLSALGGTVLASVSGLRLIALVSVLPLVAGIIAAFFLYVRDDEPVVLVANARFLVVVLAVVVAGLQRLVFSGVACLPSAVQVLATLAVTCELARWSHDHFTGDHAASVGLWSVSLAVAGSAWLAAQRWRRGAVSDAWWLAAVLAVSASILALTGYLFIWDTWLPFLNLRATAPAAVVAALIMAGRAAKARPLPDNDGKVAGMGWCAAVVGFIACTCEGPAHYLQTMTDHALAERVAIFSITVVWVVLAAGALTVGFRWRQRLVRYLALGLFALTAAKLLLIDMSGMQQLYRILAFMLVGVVLIGASYAYHRLERRLAGGPGTPPPPPAG